MLDIQSKLPLTGTNIFTIMSGMANEHNAINLGQGFPNFDAPHELKLLVKKYMDEGKNQYAPMPGVMELRTILSEKINTLYQKQIDPTSQICISAGATEAIFTAITALVHPGDEVIVFDPSYDCYRPAVELVGARVVNFKLQAPEFKIDWDHFKTKITDKTRMIIINTPHNPLGICFSETDWISLQELVKDTGIIILSDEVYEHLVFDQKAHASILKYPDLFHRALAIFSFGKTFHNTGWKTGYCIAHQNLMDEFKKVHQFNVFCANSFIQYALADYLKQPEHYLELPNFYQNKRDFFQQHMSDTAFVPLRCEGSYFQVYDYSAISDLDDLAFAKNLVLEKGVATIPVSAFYTSKNNQKLVRFCFAKTEEVLAEAAHRLSK